MNGSKFGFVMMLLVGIVPALAGGIPLDAEHWNLENAELGEFLGRKAVTGRAILEKGELRDGVIQVDLAATGERAYPGIIFHREGDRDYETLYVRPHKSNLPDAVQYAPAFNGMVGWQLFCGPGYTAKAVIPANKWNRMEIEIRGPKAIFSINGERVLEMPLKRGSQGGGMGLNAFPKNQAWFSNFRFTPAKPGKTEPVATPEIASGTILNWQLSPILATESLDTETYPANLKTSEWQKVTGEAPGFLNISRYLAKTQRWNTVMARAVVTADRAKRVRLNLGYSDRLDLFVNGQKVFHGDSEFQARDETFLGIVGLNDAVYLDLKPGDNEILAMISERFGGWAIWAKVDELPSEAIR
ncbi:hypothetical protein SCOR_30440 [Sulfidibacter corallicola]|uniref:3-keto-alpha-glucoside-1,2-lyase/3-keto-2-hydroxy-glucal hydratase domain-containing protein n=1 Tax=Sulfidibacter corallicola TaxID=2818388 RepID=A0A8A4TMK9_SULCO|nr:DUF1080 domain-containing protein [Sulfidibacter corallicola]QTD50121.1 hypothetical protein J3U87_31440 [Sulfidibacter corallicola]